MTDEQMKRIDEWMEWQWGGRMFSEVDIVASFEAVTALRAEYEEQKQWMVRFAQDSEAYRQGKSDERKSIVERMERKIRTYRDDAFHTESDDRHREYTAIADRLWELKREVEES